MTRDPERQLPRSGRPKSAKSKVTAASTLTRAGKRPQHAAAGSSSCPAPPGRAFALACAGLGVVYAGLLVSTARAIGYSRDESFYFDAARRYASWYRELFEHHGVALRQASIDAHFASNREHPPLMKTLFGLSHEHLFQNHRWVSYEGLSFRLPAMLIAGLCVTLVALWAARSLSRSAALVAALSLALMPRFFHHAHLACFDVPVATLCLATAFAWSKALDSRGWRWALVLGLVFGLALATKHNAWLLPPAFLLHAVLVNGKVFLRSGWRTRLNLLLPLAALLTVAPLVLFALWPWLWFDTGERLRFWFEFHARHEYYNMQYLGFTYWKPPMPLTYAWVMTLATVPSITLLLFVLGCVFGTRRVVASLARDRDPTRTPPPNPRTTRDFVLWLICVATFYSPWLSTNTPIFGGTKHWMTAYPFLALIAGLGFQTVTQKLPALRTRFTALNRPEYLRGALAVAMLVPGAIIVKDMGPWGLTTYTPLVGGAAGAASLGLNRTFWGYTTVALAPELAERAPARVYLHDMTAGAWDMHQRDGTLPRSLRGTGSITESDLALYHHEPHMGRVEYQIWAAYGTATPSAIGSHEGVPVVWFFDRRAQR